MKVAQLAIRFPPAPGGAETHVKAVSKELLKRGHELSVFTSDLYKEIPFTKLNEVKDLKYEDSDLELGVRRFKAMTPGGEMHYVFLPGLTKSLMSADMDIMHAHSYGYFHTASAMVRKRIKGTPFIFTPHFHPQWSMWGGEKRKGLRARYDRLVGKRVLDSVDKVIGVSRHEMELLCQMKDVENKVRVIPNGIHINRFTPIPDGSLFRSHFNIKGDMLLYVGRMASNKGLDVLVKAAAQVSKQRDVTCVFVGEDEGYKEPAMKLARKLGIEKNVLFTGHIKDNALFNSSFAACDVLVLPSEYEAFGIVLLEAMACEKPCIGSRVGGVPEVILEGKTGYIVEFGDHKAIADHALTILSDKEKARTMGKTGRKRVEDNFTWTKVVDQIEEVYREFVN